MSSYAPNYGLSAPPGALDPDLMEAFTVALQAHEGRLLVLPKVIAIKTPTAGNDWTVGVPGGVAWIVQSIRAQLATSAVAGSRLPRLRFSDGTDFYMEIPAVLGTAPNSTVIFSWIRGLGSEYQAAGTAGVIAPAPSFTLPQNHVLSVLTANIDGADTWTLARMLVLEIRERTPNERAQYMEALALGQPTTDYPGLLLGL